MCSPGFSGIVYCTLALTPSDSCMKDTIDTAGSY